MDSHPDVCNPAKDLLRNTRLQMEYVSVPQTFPPLPSQPSSSSDFINGSSYQRLDRWQAKHWYTPCKDHHSIVHRKAAIFMPSLSKYGVKKFCTSPHSSFLSRPYDPYRPPTPTLEHQRSGGVPSLRLPSGRSESSWTVDLVLEEAVAMAELDTPTYNQAMQRSPYRLPSAGGRGVVSSRTPRSGSARAGKEVTLAPLPPRSRPASGLKPPSTLPTPRSSGPKTVPPMDKPVVVQLEADDKAAHHPSEDGLLIQESAKGEAAAGEPVKEAPSTEQLAANQPPEDQSASDQAAANEKTEDQPAADQAAANQPTEDQPPADQAGVGGGEGVDVHDFPRPIASKAVAEELGDIDVPESPMPKGKIEASAAEEEGSEGKAARDDGRGTPASEEGSEGKKKKKKSKDKKPKEGNGEPEDGEEKKKKKKKKEKPADESLPPI
mmetsp:Transcript_16348/g.31389  ORF Transcript_16348/g.31389 Transcript_16348/m.31389 type:complete len:436 (-) Transcript_16348:254-1561(-)